MRMPTKWLCSCASAALITALCLIIPGCSTDKDDHDNRAEEGVVVIAVDAPPESLDPRIGTSLASYRIHQLIYSPLADQDAGGKIIPELASGWEQRDLEVDNQRFWQWIIQLRNDIRFHNGRPLTASDVVYTFRSLLSPELISRKKAAFEAVTDVNASSKYIVVFTLKKPLPWFPANLAAVGIVPEGLPTDGSAAPVGTGPFRFERREGSQQLEFIANNEYFRGATKIRKLVVRVVPDETTRTLELMHGSVDLVIGDLAPSSIPFLQEWRGLHIITAPKVEYDYLGINHKHPVLSNRLVRKAIAHSIDRETIIREYIGGLARPAVSPLLPELWQGAVSFKEHGYDPELARELLDKAGYEDPPGPGTRFSVELKCSSQRSSRDMAIIIRQQLAEVGIKVDVRSLEFQTFYADIVAGNFALYQLRWIGIVNPDFFGSAFHSTSVPGQAPVGSGSGSRRGSFNRGRYSNPEVDALIEEAETEFDPKKRWEILARLQNILSDDLPYIDLWYRKNFAVMRSDLQGLVLTLNASFKALHKVHYRK